MMRGSDERTRSQLKQQDTTSDRYGHYTNQAHNSILVENQKSSKILRNNNNRNIVKIFSKRASENSVSAKLMEGGSQPRLNRKKLPISYIVQNQMKTQNVISGSQAPQGANPGAQSAFSNSLGVDFRLGHQTAFNPGGRHKSSMLPSHEDAAADFGVNQLLKPQHQMLLNNNSLKSHVDASVYHQSSGGQGRGGALSQFQHNLKPGMQGQADFYGGPFQHAAV